MTKDYKRFYYQQRPLLNSHVVAKNSQATKFFGPSIRAVVERGKTQSSRRTNTLRDSEEFRKNYEEMPSSVQDSWVMNQDSWVMNKNKTQKKRRWDG